MTAPNRKILWQEMVLVGPLFLGATLVAWFFVVIAASSMFLPSQALEYGYDKPLNSASDSWVLLAFLAPIAIALSRACVMLIQRFRGKPTRYLSRGFAWFIAVCFGLPALGVTLAAFFEDKVSWSDLSLSFSGSLLFLSAPWWASHLEDLKPSKEPMK